MVSLGAVLTFMKVESKVSMTDAGSIRHLIVKAKSAVASAHHFCLESAWCGSLRACLYAPVQSSPSLFLESNFTDQELPGTARVAGTTTSIPTSNRMEDRRVHGHLIARSGRTYECRGLMPHFAGYLILPLLHGARAQPIQNRIGPSPRPDQGAARSEGTRTRYPHASSRLTRTPTTSSSTPTSLRFGYDQDRRT
jgi:hypothetical protein